MHRNSCGGWRLNLDTGGGLKHASEGTSGDISTKNSRTTLHSVQSIRLPGLQSLQSFFNPLLQLQPVTVQNPDGLTVLGFGIRCFPPASNEGGLCIRTPCLAHDVDECTRGLRDFRSNTLQG